MKYLVEKLIKHEIIKNYSSTIFRQDFSDAKYAFEFPIDPNKSEDEIKNELIEDIFKLTLSIRNHTGGVRHISDEDKEPKEIDAISLQQSYGGNQYLLYVIFPSRMLQHKPKKLLQGYYILIPGRPMALNLNRYYSKIESIISTNGAKQRIADPCVKQIMQEAVKFGLENIKSFDFYVFEEVLFEETSYHIIMTYNFKNEDSILQGRRQNKILSAQIAKEEAERKRQEQQKQEDAAKQLELDRKKYFQEKNKYLSNFEGPARYYAEKDWLRTYGDPRFESPGVMKLSNYTGD